MSHPLAAAARRLFPAFVAVSAVDLAAEHPALLPAEDASTSGMIPRRRQEFAAGRAAIRQAMARLGVAGQPVAMAPDRAPIWPAGLVGSLSHDRAACVAVLAHNSQARALGIDLEPDLALDPDLIDTICRPEERRWLDRQPDRLHLARLVFCAKEAAFKAQYPLTSALFGFDRLSVRLDLQDAAFTATFTAPTPPLRNGDCIAGRFSRGEGMILAAVTLPA